MRKEDYIGRRFTLDYKEWNSELSQEIGYFDDEEGTIVSLEVEIDDFESSYWNIELDNGIEISGMSGYHLVLE